MMIHDDWQLMRKRLNHDWLKNKFLVAHLNGFIARLSASNPDPVKFKEFATQDWPTWSCHREELADLIKSAEAALSPRQLLDQLPLSACNSETKDFLCKLVHDLWLTRSSIRKKIANSEVALKEADAYYQGLNPLLKSTDNIDLYLLRQSIEKFIKFDKAVMHLSDCIHQLPHNIQVV